MHIIIQYLNLQNFVTIRSDKTKYYILSIFCVKKKKKKCRMRLQSQRSQSSVHNIWEENDFVFIPPMQREALHAAFERGTSTFLAGRTNLRITNLSPMVTMYVSASVAHLQRCYTGRGPARPCEGPVCA